MHKYLLGKYIMKNINNQIIKIESMLVHEKTRNKKICNIIEEILHMLSSNKFLYHNTTNTTRKGFVQYRDSICFSNTTSKRNGCSYQSMYFHNKDVAVQHESNLAFRKSDILSPSVYMDDNKMQRLEDSDTSDYIEEYSSFYNKRRILKKESNNNSSFMIRSPDGKHVPSKYKFCYEQDKSDIEKILSSSYRRNRNDNKTLQYYVRRLSREINNQDDDVKGLKNHAYHTQTCKVQKQFRNLNVKCLIDFNALNPKDKMNILNKPKSFIHLCDVFFTKN